MKRLWWLLRIAFHDWMWEGGGHHPDRPRWLARKLPLYFSDPYADDLKAWRDETFQWAKLTFPSGRESFLRVTEPSSTWGSAVTYRYVQD